MTDLAGASPTITDNQSDRLGPPSFAFHAAGLGRVRFEGRPMSVQAPENTVCIMYRRDGDKLRQAGVGLYRDGRWTNDKRKELSGDLYWTVMVDVPHD